MPVGLSAVTESLAVSGLAALAKAPCGLAQLCLDNWAARATADQRQQGSTGRSGLAAAAAGEQFHYCTILQAEGNLKVTLSYEADQPTGKAWLASIRRLPPE